MQSMSYGKVAVLHGCTPLGGLTLNCQGSQRGAGGVRSPVHGSMCGPQSCVKDLLTSDARLGVGRTCFLKISHYDLFCEETSRKGISEYLLFQVVIVLSGLLYYLNRKVASSSSS